MGGLGAGSTKLAVAGTIVVAVIGAAFYFGTGRQPAELRAPSAAAPEIAAAAEVDPSHLGRTAPAPERREGGAEAPPQSVATTEPGGPAIADSAPSVAETEAPSLDLVRVERDGATVIAGRAAPGSDLTITRDGAPVATTRTSPSGEFVAIFGAAPGTRPISLNVEVGPDGDREGNAVALVVLPGADDGNDAELPAVVETSPQGARVVQPGHIGAPDRVSLDTISYGAGGALIVTGRGTPERVARIYADGRPLGTAEIGANGTWTVSVDDLDAGRYVLRVDEIDATGNVVSRVESPFERAFPEAGQRPSSIVVQPGNNLWTIARTYYGSGTRYTQIFAANESQIRDPDLIYPGQIFDLPQQDG
ncbi:MAG: LysM peptidoglycan-binding domain-containing protein [Pseudomonadota bacterium]